ncbi:MAG: Dabb family protein [Clostridium sp.]|nr:Dabb family protein [Clostridium sp.]
MFTHIVLFKLKDNSKDNVEFVAQRLRSMEGKINELKDIEVGVDELHTERSFDVVLITRFNSLNDMNTYQCHPYHVNEVLAKIKPLMETSKVVDFNA